MRFIGIQGLSPETYGGPMIPDACTRSFRNWVGTARNYKPVPGKCLQIEPPLICTEGLSEAKKVDFYRRLKEDYGFCRLMIGMNGEELKAAFKAGWKPNEISLWFDSFSKLKDAVYQETIPEAGIRIGDKPWDRYLRGEISFQQFMLDAIDQLIYYFSDLYRQYQEAEGIPPDEIEILPFYSILLDEFHQIWELDLDEIGIDVTSGGGYERGIYIIAFFAKIIKMLRSIDESGRWRRINPDGSTEFTKIITSAFSRDLGLGLFGDIFESIWSGITFLHGLPGSLFGNPDLSPLGSLIVTVRTLGGATYLSQWDNDFEIFNYPEISRAFDQILYSGYHGGGWDGDDQRKFWTQLAEGFPGHTSAFISLFKDYVFTTDGLEYTRLLGHATNLGWDEVTLYAASKDDDDNWSSCEEFFEYLDAFAGSAEQAGWLEVSEKDELYTTVTEYCQTYPKCKDCEDWANTPPHNWPSTSGGYIPVIVEDALPLNKWYVRDFRIGL